MANVIPNRYGVYGREQYGRKGNFLQWIFLYFVLFGMEFDIDIIGPVSLRKLAFLAVLLYIGWKGLPIGMAIRKDFLVFGMVTGIMFAYALAIQYSRLENISIPGNSTFPAIQILFQCLIFFIIPVMLTQVFRNVDEFFKVQLSIISTQALVAIVSRMSSSFRMFVYYHFVPDGDGRLLDGFERGTRVGFFGGSAASGSWILFVGCVICAYYILKTHKIKFLVLYFMILLSMMFVGRTGFYMGLLLLAILFLFMIYWYTNLAVKIMCFGGLGILAVIGYVLFSPDSYLKTTTINWVGEIFLKGFGEGSTVQALVDMGVPPLTWETVWGTGITSGTTASGIVAASDVGYIHTYMAFGIVGAAIYYLWIYGFLTHEIYQVKARYVKWVAVAFLLFIVIVEFKEPFLRKTPNAMVLNLALLLQVREERNCSGESYGQCNPNGVCDMSKL